MNGRDRIWPVKKAIECRCQFSTTSNESAPRWLWHFSERPVGEAIVGELLRAGVADYEISVLWLGMTYARSQVSYFRRLRKDRLYANWLSDVLSFGGAA